MFSIYSQQIRMNLDKKGENFHVKRHFSLFALISFWTKFKYLPRYLFDIDNPIKVIDSLEVSLTSKIFYDKFESSCLVLIKGEKKKPKKETDISYLGCSNISTEKCSGRSVFFGRKNIDCLHPLALVICLQNPFSLHFFLFQI